MSKKNKKSKSLKLEKKIKSLQIELKELKSRLRKLSPSSGPRRKSKKTKIVGRKPKLKITGPIAEKAGSPSAFSSENQSVATLVVDRS